jgi:hypothetical protein
MNSNIMHGEKQLRSICGFLAAAALVGCGSPAWSKPQSQPAFEEVSGLIRSNLAGATPAQIDRMAVQGLIESLSPRVSLADTAEDPVPGASGERGVGGVEVYRGTVGYISLRVVGASTPLEFRERYAALSASNHLTGLVLDLRGVGGNDYSAALELADAFLLYETPLMNWGEGLKSSRSKEAAITLPVAVLVDARTGGAAEALAAMLRQSGVALIFGGRTSGTAGIQRAFPLQNGQYLRITVSSVQLGNAQMIPVDGVKPDVEVKSGRSAAVADSAKVGSGPEVRGGQGTNAGPVRLRMDEADLVRRWRGEMLTARDLEQPSITNGPESRDPVLLRALDLMDGLAILRSWQK